MLCASRGSTTDMLSPQRRSDVVDGAHAVQAATCTVYDEALEAYRTALGLVEQLRRTRAHADELRRACRAARAAIGRSDRSS